MGSWSLNGTFTALPDPDYQGGGVPEYGEFLNGKPVRQGYESGLIRFPPLTTAMYNELRSRYETNKNSLVGGNLPALSGYNWQAVTAYWHEPLQAGFDGKIVNGVTMVVSHVTRY